MPHSKEYRSGVPADLPVGVCPWSDYKINDYYNYEDDLLLDVLDVLNVLDVQDVQCPNMSSYYLIILLNYS
jgi:hypothetical protein